MSVSSVVALALSSLPAFHVAEVAPAAMPSEAAERMDAYLTRLEGVGFSGVVGVRVGDSVWTQGYGLANREEKTPMTVDTILTIGSITKQFTGAAIVHLEAAGKLSVDDKLSDHFENVPADKADITLHQLLTHSAGFPGAIGHDFDDQADAEQFLDQAFATELHFTPGERFEYSNVGYSLLGILIERLTGQSYESYLREHFFEPVGMRHTGYVLPQYKTDELAVGYRDGERWGTFYERPMLADGPSWHLRANGGIHSTVGDMLRWRAALDTDAVLPASARRKLFTRHMPEGGGGHYGYGWSVDETPWGAARISHNGGNMTFFADLHQYPDDDMTLYVATNVASSFGGLSRALVHVLFDREANLPPETVALNDSELAAFAGTYSLNDGKLHVEAAAGRLALRAEGTGLLNLLTGENASLADQTMEIAKGIAEGDVSDLVAVFGGRMSPDELKGAFDGLREMWAENFGTFRKIGSYGARDAESFAELRFAEGSEFMIFRWSEGKVIEVGLESDAPWRSAGQSGTISVYPVGDGHFEAWSLGGGKGVTLRFENTGGRRTPVLER